MPSPSFRPRAEELETRDTPAGPGIFAVGAGPGGSPRVQVFETNSGRLVGDFLAYEPTFTGGVTAAVGDVNNDGFSDLVVGAGVGGGPRVRVFNGTAFRPPPLVGTIPSPINGIVSVPPVSISGVPLNGTAFVSDTFLLADFFAFEASQRGGSFVGAGNFAGASNADIVVGAGPGGGPRVRILDGFQVAQQGRLFTSNGLQDTVANFFAFESSFRNGVVVAAAPTVGGGGFSDLVVAPGVGGGPRVRILDGNQIAIQRGQFTSFGPLDTVADFFVGDQNNRTGLSVAFADYNRDGLADVAVGPGAGVAATVTVFSGALIRQRGRLFSGSAPGDVLTSFTVFGDRGYTNGVTVGSAIQANTFTDGLLLVGTGGQGLRGRTQVLRFDVGSGFLTSTLLYDLTFSPNFGGVFVSG